MPNNRVVFLYFLACGQISGTLTICAIFPSYKLRSQFPYRKFLVVIVCLWVVVIILGFFFSWHNKRLACNKVKERWSLPVFFFTHISVVLYWCEIFYIFESWTNTHTRPLPGLRTFHFNQTFYPFRDYYYRPVCIDILCWPFRFGFSNSC
jgi:hypothetical protein